MAERVPLYRIVSRAEKQTDILIYVLCSCQSQEPIYYAFMGLLDEYALYPPEMYITFLNRFKRCEWQQWGKMSFKVDDLS